MSGIKIVSQLLDATKQCNAICLSRLARRNDFRRLNTMKWMCGDQGILWPYPLLSLLSESEHCHSNRSGGPIIDRYFTLF